MRWEDIDQQACSVARTLAVIGDRWTLLILRDAFLGTRRFEAFQRSLGISRHRLSDRLNKLVQQGVFNREAYQQRPQRFEYRLSRKGLALYPVMMTIAQWGNEWCDDGNGAPIEYLHRSCGQHTHAVLSCSECGERLQPAEVSPQVGPGLAAAMESGRPLYGNSEQASDPARQLPPLLQKSWFGAGSSD
ncbi:MAG: helix-turn-helix domain-containing protein [Halieaceae bacterium]